MTQADIPESSLEAERYRVLIEAVTDYAIYMLDPAGIVSSWNPGAQRFKGYTRDEIVGQHFSRFYSEEDRNSGLPARALETAVREGKFENEGWRIRKDGTRFWAYVVIDPIRSKSGKIVGFAKITRDLTERRNAELSLKRSEEQFRMLVQGVTDYAIYMLDTEGHITNWNLGAQRIKGYSPDEIIGHHFSKFYTEAEREAGLPERALDVAAQEGRFEREAWRIRKDGSRFWAHVVIDPIRGDSGDIIGYAKITRDVTERKEAQEKLEKAREALLQSQKMEAIGQLTGGVAHDFNNLLMAVLGSLELLRKRMPDDPRMHALLDNAVQGARRGTSLTQRMLAFARAQELKPDVIAIPDLVRGMTDLLRRSLGPQVSIETRFPLLLAPVDADANQLEMVLLNLMLNSRDAMPSGGEIVIAARGEDVTEDHGVGLKPGRYVCLSVSDTGEGMDEGTLQKATEPFFTTKDVGKGTGLGLSMVHGFAEQSGGRFVLRSRKGEGTTADLWLPAATHVPETDAAVVQTVAPVEKQYPLVVLAVDDDALVLMNTVGMLEDLGHVVYQACSGREALDILRRESIIDLVITDQAMPQMTGTQLAKAIWEEWPDTPVMLATGYADIRSEEQTGLPKLTKPFFEVDLATALAGIKPKRRSTDRVVPFRPHQV